MSSRQRQHRQRRHVHVSKAKPRLALRWTKKPKPSEGFFDFSIIELVAVGLMLYGVLVKGIAPAPALAAVTAPNFSPIPGVDLGTLLVLIGFVLAGLGAFFIGLRPRLRRQAA